MMKFSISRILMIQFVLAVLLPIIVISGIGLILLQNSLEKHVIEQNETYTDSLSQETSAFFRQAEAVLGQVADDCALIDFENRNEVALHLENFIKNFPFFDSIQIVNTDGNIESLVPNQAEYIGLNLSGHDYYRQARSSGVAAWSQTFMSLQTGYPTISLAVPYANGTVIGNLNLSTLNAICSRYHRLNHGWVAIMDSQGTFIGHSDPQQVEQRSKISDNDKLQPLLSERNTLFSIPYNDKQYLVSAVPIRSENHIDWTVAVAENEEEAYKNFYILRRVFLIAVVAGLILAAKTALWTGRKIVTPLTGLNNRIKQVAAGHYQISMPVQPYWEFALIEEHFVEMASAVAERETTIIAKTREVEMYLQRLQDANKELERFAYVASHDLRAPLRAIDNLVAWIAEDLGTVPMETEQKIQLLRNRVKRMDNLITGILEYSRVGRINYQVEKIDTNELVRQVIDDLLPPESFAVVIDGHLPLVHAQKVRLSQVFSNLIGNAIKHHDRNAGNIAISCSELVNYFEFRVADDGPGILPQFHEKVYEMFQTLRPRDQFESTGIGLSLVKRIIEQVGGTIRLESSGRGATFIFTWPKRLAGEG